MSHQDMQNIYEPLLEGGQSTSQTDRYDQNFQIRSNEQPYPDVQTIEFNERNTQKIAGQREYQQIDHALKNAPLKFEKDTQKNDKQEAEDFKKDREYYFKSRYIHEMKVDINQLSQLGAHKQPIGGKIQAQVDDQKDEDAPEEDDLDDDLVYQDLKLREMEYVSACLDGNDNNNGIQPSANKEMVVIDYLLYKTKKDSISEIEYCYAKKICDKTKDSMILQIIKNDKLVFQETIQKTYHLFGLAKLDIHPDYISYMQHGNMLYYFKQVIVDDHKKHEDEDNKPRSKQTKLVKLMEVDLTQNNDWWEANEVEQMVEGQKQAVQMEVVDDPRHPKYKGTLVGMLILPSYQKTSSFNKQKGLQAFLQDNFVLFLYKSNKTPKYSQEYTSAGDSFTISCISQLDKVLYDSVDKKHVFSQEIQALSPIFLRIKAENFEYKGETLDSNDEIIFLSFLEPDDDDDVTGFFNESHRKCFQAIAKKTGRDHFQVLKIKTVDKTEIINIDEDENKKLDQKQLQEQNEQIKGTLENWAAHIKEISKDKVRINSCIHLDRSKLTTTKRFCQINEILQNQEDNYQDISVVLDHQKRTVHILNSDVKKNMLTEYEVNPYDTLVGRTKKYSYDFMNIKAQQKKNSSKKPNQLKQINKLFWLTSKEESYKLTYNIHQQYNNLLAYHNDLEQKVVTLEDQGKLVRIKDADFKLMKYFVSNVITHKSPDFLDKKNIIEQSKGKIFVGMNIQIRTGGTMINKLQRARTSTKINESLKVELGNKIDKNDLNKSAKTTFQKLLRQGNIDALIAQNRYYFKMMPRGDTDPSHYKAILPIYLKDDSIPKNADALIIVPEKVTYANDDRSIRPFILIKTDDKDHTQVSRVRKIWLAMIDIKNSHIIHINEQRLQGDIFVNYKTVQKNFKFVMSSNILYGQRKDDHFLEQKYQLYIKYDDIDYAIIKEFRVRWTRKKENDANYEHQNYRAWSRIIGQKFVATNGDYSLQKSELFPLFDDQNGNIIGTQIFTGQCQESSHIIEIPNLEQAENKYHEQYQNHSNYRRYPLIDDIELVIFEVGLSDLMKKHLWQKDGGKGKKNAYFSAYDLNEILDNGLKIIMNLVPIDFMGLVSRNNIQNYPYMGYSLVAPLEILDGETIISRTIKEPQVLEELIESKDKSFEKQTFTLAFIERLANNPQQWEFLQNNQFLFDRAAPETSMGIDQVPLLRKVLINKEPTQIRMIAENLFERNDLHRYEFLMASLYEAEKSSQFQCFFPFFNCASGDLNFDRKVQDPRFKHFSNKKRNVVTYENLVADFEQNEIIEKIIYEELSLSKYEYEIEHSFIDLRPMLLDQKCQALIGKELDDDMEIRMNEFEIATIINKIFNEDTPEGEIDNQKILRVIITHQFNTYSRKYYIMLFFLFVFGYFIPLLLQIIIELSDFGMVMASFVFFMTHLTLFYIETIQMRCQEYKEYFGNWVNISEIMSFLVSVYFTYMKLLDPANRYFANHSEVFKVTEQEGIKVKMIMAGGFLVVMSMMKLLSLLKAFDTFGNFVFMVLKCVKSSVVFCIFLAAWVFIFSMLLMVVGCRFDDGDYPSLSLRDMTMIQVYRNSIGDIAAPKYDLWYDPDKYIGELDGFYQGKLGKIMVYMIWAIWFLNQFFCMVMLMNFLITIISDEYAQISSAQNHYTYMRRKELNFDCLCVFNFFQQLEDFNTLIIWSDPEKGGALSKNKDVASNIKKFISEKNNTVQNKLLDNMRSQQVELQKSVEDINEEIDEVKKSQSGGKDKILNASRQKVQSQVSDILNNNQNEIQGKFELVQDKIQKLSSEISVTGQGNQGIQKEVVDIEKEQAGLVKDIKKQVGDAIKDKKEELTLKVEKIGQVQSKVEIDAVLQKIQDQEKDLNTVKVTIQNQEKQVKKVLEQIDVIKQELKTKLTQQDEHLEEMSKAVQKTLESNLTTILTQITSKKQEELDTMKQNMEKAQEEAKACQKRFEESEKEKEKLKEELQAKEVEKEEQPSE